MNVYATTDADASPSPRSEPVQQVAKEAQGGPPSAMSTTAVDAETVIKQKTQTVQSGQKLMEGEQFASLSDKKDATSEVQNVEDSGNKIVPGKIKPLIPNAKVMRVLKTALTQDL